MIPTLTAVELILETGAVLALVLGYLFFARRKSAATQHHHLSVAVLVVLSLTLLSPFVPSRQLGVIPIPASLAQPEEGVPSGTSLAPLPSPSDRNESPLPPEPLRGETRQSTGRSWSSALPVVWALGSAILIVWMLLGMAYSWWLSRQAQPTESPELADRFRWALAKVGVGGRVIVVESRKLRIPVVFGIVRPRVILPTHANHWSEDRLTAVLLHESAHIRRRDLVFQFLAKLTCALYWFNPLAWLIERKLFLAGERAADDQVVREYVSPADYAEHLMETSVELGTERNPIWATAAMAEGTAFKDRILSILDPTIRRGEPNMFSQAAVALSAIALVVSLLAFSPWRGASSPTDQTVSSPATAGPGETAAVQQDTMRQGGTEDLQTLLQMLRLADPSMREHATTALGRLGDRRAVPPLIDVILSDRDASVRAHACEALGVLGDDRAQDGLIQVVLADQDAGVREHAVAALAQLGTERAALPLIDVILNDSDASVREHACTVLGALGDARAREPLIKVMLDDPSPQVREHAATALGQLGDRRSYDVLLGTMYGEDMVRVRAHAAHALGLLGDSRALEPLVAALRDESPIMRMNAALGLGELGDARAQGALRQAQSDPDEQVRYQVEEALRKIRGR